jgi:hypothetical protein
VLTTFYFSYYKSNQRDDKHKEIVPILRASCLVKTKKYRKEKLKTKRGDKMWGACRKYQE